MKMNIWRRDSCSLLSINNMQSTICCLAPPNRKRRQIMQQQLDTCDKLNVCNDELIAIQSISSYSCSLTLIAARERVALAVCYIQNSDVSDRAAARSQRCRNTDRSTASIAQYGRSWKSPSQFQCRIE
jgi:hypothetical protein